uniref:Importin N-terminal domain-containing protein n=1 Tax=Arcella intermedia TaxID=1963864 RepID=A0A6B2KXQ3_9EUKA
MDGYQKKSGFLGSILKFVSEECQQSTPTRPLEIPLCATLYLKNFIRLNWKNIPKIPISERNLLKMVLPELICGAPGLVQIQLELILRIVISYDFEEYSATLVTKIMELLSSKDGKKVYGGLICVYSVIKTKEEFKEEFLGKILPLLIGLFESYREFNVSIVRNICRILWKSVKEDVHYHMMDPQCFSKWNENLLFILHQFTKEFKSSSEVTPYWSTCIYISKIFKVFMKNDVFELSDEVPGGFIDSFRKKYVESIIGILMNFERRNHYPEQFKDICFSILDASLEHPAISTLLYQNLEFLITKIIFYELIFTEKQNNLWVDDPVEYVRNTYESDATDSRTVSELILNLVGNDSALYSVTNWIFTILSNKSLPINEMYGILMLIYILKKNIISHIKNINIYFQKQFGFQPDFNFIEFILLQYIVPNLSSNVPFIRAICASIFGELYRSAKVFHESQNLQQVATILYNGLMDKEFPVQFCFVIPLAFLMEDLNEEQLVKSYLPRIVEVILKHMQKLEDTQLFMALQFISQKYVNLIQDIIPAIVRELVLSYQSDIADIPEGKNLFEEITVFQKALTYLQSIEVILENSKSCIPIIEILKPIIIPILLNVREEVSDLFLDIIKITTLLTYYGNITTELFAVFEKFIQIYFDWGSDFINDLLNPFDNFISKCPEYFVKRNLVKDVLSIYQESVSDTTYLLPISQLMEVVLVNCRGLIDDRIPNILDITFYGLERAKNTKEKEHFSLVLSNCIYYNPQIFLIYLNKTNKYQSLAEWIGIIKVKASNSSLKIHILALSSLLLNPVPTWHNLNLIIPIISTSILLLKQPNTQLIDEDKDELDEPDEDQTGEAYSILDPIDPSLFFSNSLKLFTTDPLIKQNIYSMLANEEQIFLNGL